MKRTILILACGTLLAAGLPAWPQVRFALTAMTPIDELPGASLSEWYRAALPSSRTMSGWRWEAVFDRVGLGMQGSGRFEGSLPVEPCVEWKGDVFVSYHLLGRRSAIDPFVELGWGTWGSAASDSRTVSVLSYSYAAAGLAANLDGLLLGARLAAMPLRTPIVCSAYPAPPYAPYEIGLFAGLALGGRTRR